MQGSVTVRPSSGVADTERETLLALVGTPDRLPRSADHSFVCASLMMRGSTLG